MKYTAIKPTGEPITTVEAHLKSEARAKLEMALPLLKYGKEWKIVTDYGIQQRIERGILKACFGSY